MEDKNILEATLLFPVMADKVGLGLKKQKVGAGFLNGWGGLIDPGESELQGVVREVFEEGGIRVDPHTLTKAAVMLFHNEKFDCRVHIFLAPWAYKPLEESAEMGPLEWYDRLNPPLSRMMPADRLWVPRILAGEYIVGEAWYGPGQKSLVRPCKLTAVPAQKLPSFL